MPVQYLDRSASTGSPASRTAERGTMMRDWPSARMMRGAHSLLRILTPILQGTSAGMPKGRESGSASALFNMMRNIGGSIGIAGPSTLLSVRERFHSERIGESVTAYSGAVQERVQQSAAYFLTQGSDSHSANKRAIGAIGGAVRDEAFLLSCGDCFLALGCVLRASASVLFFMKRARISGAVGGH
jgi:MFS transporter, DHA2 family, multidrug resistance protein